MHKYMAQMIEYVQERNAEISDDGGLYEGGPILLWSGYVFSYGKHVD